MSYFHQPVLLGEVLEYLQPKPNQNFIDCTVGGGGHAEAILEKTSPRGKLLGLDRDPAAIAASLKRLNKYKNRITLIQDSYKNLDKILYGKRLFLQLSGILLDLGISSYQVSIEDQRGFSFRKEAPLDMRFGPDGELTAEKILNNYSEKKLTEIFKKFGEEPRAKQLAKQIILFRKREPIRTTSALMGTIKKLSAIQSCSDGLHPATRVFQALRIAVNDELNVLEESLPKLLKILPVGGRLAVISFHSLEDRIVKQYFNQESKDCLCPKEIPVCRCSHQKTVKILNKKVIIPRPEEVRKNPRSRSAKLRVVERI
ncbi:16S rRNA (cytosine(1402)-N(4))-methyltransferase RsmH [Patescibacteria group bacterium]|nr:16S rRNA (cytosine(1402)-N(4))-methyltransferase RsmH [Patescibacteria group bacterium]